MIRAEIIAYLKRQGFSGQKAAGIFRMKDPRVIETVLKAWAYDRLRRTGRSLDDDIKKLSE